MMRYPLLAVTAVVSGYAANTAAAADPYSTLYDIIVVREAADGSVVATDPASPLLWSDSEYLVATDARPKLQRALDAFNALSSKQLQAYPPVNRALLQHHAWSVFDWTTTPGKSPDARLDRLQKSLATTIRKVALSREDIDGLPNSLRATIAAQVYPRQYDAGDPWKSFLPSDLAEADGSWVCLAKSDHAFPAKLHTESVSSRSAFLIYLRLPQGRRQTLDYLGKLAAFRTPWLAGDQQRFINIPQHPTMWNLDLHVNPRTPQFPVGTQVALVKQALLIDQAGSLVLSPLVQNIQLRAYLDVEVDARQNKPAQPTQAFAEFVLQPKQLMLDKIPLRAVAADEIRYTTTFLSSDPIEHPKRNTGQVGPRLHSCVACHSGTGIHSINSRSELFQARSLLPPRFESTTAAQIAAATARGKRESYSWGLLQGLWRE